MFTVAKNQSQQLLTTWMDCLLYVWVQILCLLQYHNNTCTDALLMNNLIRIWMIRIIPKKHGQPGVVSLARHSMQITIIKRKGLASETSPEAFIWAHFWAAGGVKLFRHAIPSMLQQKENKDWMIEPRSTDVCLWILYCKQWNCLDSTAVQF